MIRVSNLNKTYDAGRRHANHVLRDVSFDLPDTGFVCIVGASGCGKTSLLNAVGGLDRFDNGTISTDSVSVSRYGTHSMERERNNSFGYIFQNYYLLTDHSVAYNVYLGLHALGLSHKEKLQRVREALEAVNMARFSRRIAGDLSGGQQQRVAIARALARRPRVIFADEPTGNLDEKNTLNICTLLRRISKNSLVIMVTHEEHIARFFADHIITIHEGQIQNVSSSWERGTLTAAGNELYAGDMNENSVASEEISLRVLREKDAAPAQLTVAVLKDRIIIKLDDARTVSCSPSKEDPVILEGKRPELVLESLDNTPDDQLFTDERPVKSVRAGKGLPLGMLLDEAVRLLKGKGLRFITTWIFLAALSVLTTFIVSDYLTVSSVDPHDFVITDSHILKLEFERGVSLPKWKNSSLELVRQYLDVVEEAGLDFDFIPNVSTTLQYSTEILIQTGTMTADLGSYSHALISRLDESDLIYGRMPEKSDEIVIDRWVLDAFLAKDGIIQSSFSDISDFVGMQLQYFKSTYAPTVVGISDCGDPTVYLPIAGMISVGRGGTTVMPLSELQAMYPGVYDDVVLGETECLVVLNVAGPSYVGKVGRPYKVCNGYMPLILDAIEADTWARIIVPDEELPSILETMCRSTTTMLIYFADKQAAKEFLAQEMPLGLRNMIQLRVTDIHGDSWAKYINASTMKADARTIVTVTVIALCMVMLYLLQRSSVQQRIGMMAVYRLLGIPRRKLLVIYSIESLLFSLTSVLPATALTWLVIQVLSILPSVEFSMILPVSAAGAVCAAIAAYYLAVSLLPTYRLLQLPPARLASKYDL